MEHSSAAHQYLPWPKRAVDGPLVWLLMHGPDSHRRREPRCAVKMSTTQACLRLNSAPKLLLRLLLADVDPWTSRPALPCSVLQAPRPFRDTTTTWNAEAKRLAPIRALCLLDGLRLRLQLAAPLRNALPNLRMKCACQYIASPLDRSDEDALGRASTCSMQRTCRPNQVLASVALLLQPCW